MKEIVIGIVAGLVLGLPQGMRDLPMLSNMELPIETIQVIGAFGLFGGFIMGLKLLSRANKKDYSTGGYFFFTVGTLSIGIPTLIRHYKGSLVESITMPGLFFTAIGLAMILGGVTSHVFSKNT